MTGRTRIHLDTVDGLGEFMELEVVLASGIRSINADFLQTGVPPGIVVPLFHRPIVASGY